MFTTAGMGQLEGTCLSAEERLREVAAQLQVMTTKFATVVLAEVPADVLAVVYMTPAAARSCGVSTPETQY